MSENTIAAEKIKSLATIRAGVQDQIQKKNEEMERLKSEDRTLGVMISALQRLVNPARLRPRAKREQS